ncbi:Ig-like domain-containing protein [Flavisolibacter ginsenosidimutans]|uniref:SbsA Ig-like domain-containing protein n=1 Tax=Flavisolibacter ginsenosidimutans TaxID=661481 RepID=A0A5B8UNC4_9BACT|nr:Ig-like domain-containing protein [Flavisolibacter ginsenosidimutans]QEC57475.1 hypothetical protein FSB75_16735 [Flavisolibacter ginsenosidimutans]
MRRTAFFLFALGFVVFWAVLSTGCANIIPPSGGPRDSLPPHLISVSPRDSTRNFHGNRIVFTFDEYIADPQDLPNTLLFTPTFEVNPEIAIRAKTVTLRFRDSLLPNTTYTFNFGNAIRDVNEGNAIKNFTYVLSTGPVLDSLSLSGKVILAETGKVDSSLIVMLHRNRTDSAVIKDRPEYFARLDGAGNFRFQNLPRDTFALYALGDAGTIRRYQDTSKLFAFANDPVIPGVTKDLVLYAYRSRQPSAATSAARNGNNTTEKRLRFSANPSGGNLDLQSDFSLNFQSPLRSFDSSKVLLTTDTTFAPVRYTVSLDSLRTTLRLRSAWAEGKRYNLILNKDFADDSAGRKLLKTDTLNFTTKKLSDYGKLNIRIRNLDTSRNPVLQFLQNDGVVFSVNIKGGVYRSTLFNPGDYDLRILYDTNNNGKWDPGRFFGAKRQPEIAQPVSRKIVVKAGGDNDFDVTL